MSADGDLLAKTITVVLAYSGLRPAESLGLELGRIRQDTLIIEQAVSHGKLKLQKTGRVYRSVDLLDAPRADLDVWVLTRTAPTTTQRMPARWPWADDFLAALAGLRALPPPA